MQISDMISQYNQNATPAVPAATKIPEAQQLVDAVRSMTAGNIFEGTVNSVKHGQVTLGLVNGQTISARLTAGVSLSVGQSMFFQVRSNNGTQVEIRPYNMAGNVGNPTLLKALESAGVPANERTVAMVNTMMEEQMSISRQSILDMVRTVGTDAGINVQTAVEMAKLGIPVTGEFAAQFENYKMDQSAITSQMNTLFESLPGLWDDAGLSDAAVWNLNSGMLDILNTEVPPIMLPEMTGETQTESAETQSELAAASSEELADEVQGAGEDTLLPAAHNQADYDRGTLGNLLDAEQVSNLTKQLQDYPEVMQDAKLFADGRLNLNLTGAQFLQELQAMLDNAQLQENGNMKELLNGKEYQGILKDVLEQQWLVRPEELQSEHRIHDLYDKLERQMTQLEQLFKQTGVDQSQLAKTTIQIRGNVDFMNQINQTYNYVQIPLKMAHQNAHSDLYVYTNKKNLQDPEGELSAFLHLDMDNLGSTDVSVKMQNRQVQTNFYLADDRSYELIMEHADILAARLEKKGYNCTIKVENQGKKVDFVEDFLKKDQPSANMVHRYSFDVRA